MHAIPMLFALSALLLAACGGGGGSESGGPQQPGPGGGGTGGGSDYGEFIAIDGAAPWESILDMRVTNSGLYLRNVADEGTRVYRLNLGGPSPVWRSHDHDDHLFSYMPTSMRNEGTDVFSYFYMTIGKNGYISYNNSTPFLESDNPKLGGFYRPNFMVVDNGTHATTWAIFEDNYGLTTVQYRIGANASGDIYTTALNAVALPVSVEVVEADDDDGFLWAGGGSYVYIFDSSSYKAYDLSAYASFGAMEYVQKIRVVNDEAWVGTGSRIFRVRSNGQVTLFATLTGVAAAMSLGDFAVDGGYVYTTDGEKIDIQFDNRSPILPPMPTSSTEEMMHYLQVQGALHAGPLEVSTDPLNPFIYSLSTTADGYTRVVRIPKD